VKSGAFTAEWVERRVAALVPTHPHASLCVALSGGLDSVVLLASLAGDRRVRARKSRGGLRSRRTSLRAVHVHHGLHANADKWSEHCAALARKLGVPLTTLRVKVARTRGSSREAAAREARYEALARALEPDEILLTAHHQDDQLETVLLQLMRGAGIAGLAAMPEVAPFARGLLVRPLLTRTRAELEEWARAQGLTWMEDDTNENEQLDRNYLRRRVLPLIRERWPSASRAVSRSARHAAEAQRLLDTLALADIERASNGRALSVQHLRSLSSDRRRNAVRYWIARAGHTLPDSTRLDEVTRTLLDARPDSNPTVVWNTSRIHRHAGYLHLEGEPDAPLSTTMRKRAASTPIEDASTPVEDKVWNWRARSTTSLDGARGSLSIESDPHGPIDLDTLPDTLIIRTRRGGERLRPKPRGRTRALKSLLQESHTPLAERATMPLVFANDHLIAVADRWLDHSIQAHATTRHRGRLRWSRA
jgi:tRNA(Ile)-lysidine synthase